MIKNKEDSLFKKKWSKNLSSMFVFLVSRQGFSVTSKIKQICETIVMSDFDEMCYHVEITEILCEYLNLQFTLC